MLWLLVIILLIAIVNIYDRLGNQAQKIRHLEEQIEHTAVNSEKKTTSISDEVEPTTQSNDIFGNDVLTNIDGVPVVLNSRDLATSSMTQVDNRQVEQDDDALVSETKKSKEFETIDLIQSAENASSHQGEESEDIQINTGEDDPFSPLINWLSENWQMKIGAIIFLLGLIRGVSYAFANNRISPLARVILGIGLGCGMIIGGWSRMTISRDQGVVLASLGGGCALASLYLGRMIYGFFSPSLILLVGLLIVGWLQLIALRETERRLGLISFIVGAIVPLLTGVTEPDFIGLFLYLFILISGTLVVVHKSGWTFLSFLSLVTYLFYALPFITGSTAVGDIEGVYIVSIIFFFLFVASNILDMTGTKTKEVPLSSIVALFNGLILLWRVSSHFPEDIRSIVLLTVSGVFGRCIMRLRSVPSYNVVSNTYLGLAVVFIGFATAFEFSGPALFYAYILEISVIIWLLYEVFKKYEAIPYVVGLYMGPFFLSLDIFNYTNRVDGIIHPYFFQLLCLIGVCFAVYVVLTHLHKAKVDTEQCRTLCMQVKYIFLWLGIGFIYCLIHLSTISFDADERSVFRLIFSLLTLCATHLSAKIIFEGPGRVTSKAILLVPTLIYIGSLVGTSLWETSLLHGGLYALLLTGAAFVFLGRYAKGESAEETFISNLYLLLSVIVFYLLVHIGFNSFLDDFTSIYRLIFSLVILFAIHVFGNLFFKDNELFIYKVIIVLPSLIYTGMVYDISLRNSGVSHGGLYSFILAGAVFFFLGRYTDSTSTEGAFLKKYYAFLGVATSMLLVWRSSLSLVENINKAHMISLIIYTCISCGLYVLSAGRKSKKYLLWISGLILGFVVLRLVIVEVWQMVLGRRIVTFISIGALLILSALLINTGPKDISEHGGSTDGI